MNKNYIQGVINKNQVRKKEINPKNQKNKLLLEIQLKNKDKNIKKINDEKRAKINSRENKKGNLNNISKLENESGVRYFGIKLDNPSILGKGVNQHIIKGNNLKNYNGRNICILNKSINGIYDNNTAYLELLNIKYKNKPQNIIEYRSEIFENLIKDEINNVPYYGKLKDIIVEETRNKYILYIITVCDKITRNEEILYLSINIFDRVICKLGDIKENMTDKKLQLICFTSLFIAYKYETGCYFLIDDLLKHTEDSLVDKKEVLQFENEINKILNFEYLIVYPSHFIKHFELIDNINNPKIFYFCFYLIDFIIFDIKLLSNKISLLSASCYFIAKACLLKINAWPNIFQFMTGYSKNEIKELSIKIIKGMKNSKNSAIFKCLKKKYSKVEYSKIVDLTVAKK